MTAVVAVGGKTWCICHHCKSWVCYSWDEGGQKGGSTCCLLQCGGGGHLVSGDSSCCCEVGTRARSGEGTWVSRQDGREEEVDVWVGRMGRSLAREEGDRKVLWEDRKVQGEGKQGHGEDRLEDREVGGMLGQGEGKGDFCLGNNRLRCYAGRW